MKYCEKHYIVNNLIFKILNYIIILDQNGLKYNFMAADFFVAIIFFILPPIAKNIN